MQNSKITEAKSTGKASLLSLIQPVLRFYRPEPVIAPLPPEKVASAFAHWRIRMLAAMFFAYGILYFGRKNIAGVLPLIGKDLGYSNIQLGVLGSTLYITYGLGKFANGVLADRANIRRFMATSLILSGIVNLWMANLVSLGALAFAWGLNGWVQSMGFPPIARGLTIWYEPEGKGKRWAIWTTSHQAGTAAILAITAFLIHRTGDWRNCFYVPGIFCILMGIVSFFTLADTPESQGLARPRSFEADRTDADAQYWSLFYRRVLLNGELWVVAGVNLFVYIVRYGTLDWIAKFLVERKGYSMASAAGMAATMPLFGIAGVLVAGWASDSIFRGSFRLINSLMLLVLALTLFAFVSFPGQNYGVDFALLAAVGFLVEGPQSLLGGVASVDVGGSARVASAAAGLVGICGYFGATASSLGTGYFVDQYGWDGGFAFWIVCAAAGFFLCAFVWRWVQWKTLRQLKRV